LQLEIVCKRFPQFRTSLKDRIRIAAHCAKFVRIKFARHPDDTPQVDDWEAIRKGYQHRDEQQQGAQEAQEND
jgi:hypothetical protein